MPWITPKIGKQDGRVVEVYYRTVGIGGDEIQLCRKMTPPHQKAVFYRQALSCLKSVIIEYQRLLTQRITIQENQRCHSRQSFIPWPLVHLHIPSFLPSFLLPSIPENTKVNRLEATQLMCCTEWQQYLLILGWHSRCLLLLSLIQIRWLHIPRLAWQPTKSIHATEDGRIK